MNDRTTEVRLPNAKDVLKAVDTGGRHSQGGVKETIESILIAFIFAFMFRAFVVEAFVIPTGSMATTLLGAHMRVQCQDCGHEFKVNYSSPPRRSRPRGDDSSQQDNPNDLAIPSRLQPLSGGDKYKFTCENCGYVNSDPSPIIHFGDRILVLKYLYLFQDPARWDVVVFKSPFEPETYKYEQNYIKRLVGRPNESILILDGDIYVGIGKDQPREQFTVQTKPRVVQDALWRIVYDNDHYPKRGAKAGDGRAWRQPWAPQSADSGWNLGDNPLNGRVFSFEKSSGTGSLKFDRSATTFPRQSGRTPIPEKQTMTDWLGYDQHSDDNLQDRDVSDLKLELFYERKSGDGPLRLKLSKYDDTFIAEIGRESAKLIRRNKSGDQVISDNIPLSESSAPLHVELMNVDYQVTLRLDGQDVAQTTAETYSPDIPELWAKMEAKDKTSNPGAEIEADSQSCQISHIRLWRDIYYTNYDNRYPRDHFWASPNNIIHLGPDEYFVLGDNSQLSGDSRYWPSPINLPDEELRVDAGKVPARFMLGKAFFVYWPAGYPISDGSRPSIIPNFGEMRFIH